MFKVAYKSQNKKRKWIAQAFTFEMEKLFDIGIHLILFTVYS